MSIKQAQSLDKYKDVGEQIASAPFSDEWKVKTTRSALKEVVKDPDYQEIRRKYLNEKRSESAKEKLFQEAFAHFKKLKPETREEDFRAMIDGKSEKKESKEKMNTPELESENHKIDQGKSKKEKLAEGWKEEERPAYINGSETKIKVLKKELAPGAFVWEYQDDVPNHLRGEQLFNRKAVLSLWLEKQLPTWENMQTMRWETVEENQNFLKNNFQKDGKNLFPGGWDPDVEGFDGMGEWTGCWLADGDNVKLNEDSMGHDNSNHEFGIALRLLKN